MTRFSYCLAAFCSLFLLPSLLVLAGEGCCDHCGCRCECQRVCRMVCEMKEISKTTWSCKCEDFCVPGRSQRCHSDCNCGHCVDCRDAAWVPTAAYVKTRKVPVKQVKKSQVPSYRFVVDYLCPNCGK